MKKLNPDKIILFGSYAYGTPNEDSDIDLFLLKDELSANHITDVNHYIDIIALELHYTVEKILKSHR